MATPVRRSTDVLLYLLLCAIWGSTWLVIKVGYGGLGAFNVAAIRFLLAGALLVPVALALRVPWPQGRAQWGLVLFVGAVLFAADYGLIYWGEQWLDSGLTAILFAVMPLTTAVFAHAYIPGDRLSPRKLGGTILAFLGVVALFADHLVIDPTKALPMAAILASTVAAAAASVATKRHGKALHPAALNAPAMLFGGLLLLAASLVAGDGFALPRDAPTWGAIAYLAVAGSIVTFLVYFTLMKRWNVTTMSFVSVFTTIVALLLGFVILGERPTPWTALGALLVLGGVSLALTRAKAPAAPPPIPAPEQP